MPYLTMSEGDHSVCNPVGSRHCKAAFWRIITASQAVHSQVALRQGSQALCMPGTQTLSSVVQLWVVVTREAVC